MTCGKCGATEGVARLTYTDLKTRKSAKIDRCEGCLEKGLQKSKPEVAGEVMSFARTFLFQGNASESAQDKTP